MTKKELEERLLTIISNMLQTADGDFYIENTDRYDAVIEIISAFKEIGYKSPEEVDDILWEIELEKDRNTDSEGELC